MNKAYYTLKRETSKYNKYMKWHLEYFREDGSLLSSEYFKTKNAATISLNNAVLRGQQGFPIGDRLSFTNYYPK